MEEELKAIFENLTEEKLSEYMEILQKLGVAEKKDVLVLGPKDLQPMSFCHAQRFLKHFQETPLTPTSSELTAKRNKRPLEGSPLVNFSLDTQRLPTQLSEKLNNKEKLEKCERRDLVNFIAGEIQVHCSSPPGRMVDKIASETIEQYPSTFALTDAQGNFLRSNASSALSYEIKNRLKNQNSKYKKVRRELYAPGEQKTEVLENEQDLVEIKQKLKLEHLQHVHSNDNASVEVVSLMAKTYALRKKNIKDCTNRQVLTDWPCLFSSVFLLDQDFQKLMGINLGGCESHVARKICETIKTKPKYKKHVMKSCEELEKAFGKTHDFTPYVPYMYVMLMEIFQDSKENIFKIYAEEATVPHILEDLRLPTPTVIVRGGDIHVPQQIAIVFERQFLDMKLCTFQHAILTTLKIYYVLNLKYAPNTENFYNFITTYFGSITDLKKKDMRAKVLGFLQELSRA